MNVDVAACDERIRTYLNEHLVHVSQYPAITEVMFEIKDGYLDVPTGPGLGVELDQDKLAKYERSRAKRRRAPRKAAADAV